METNSNSIWPSVKHWEAGAFEIITQRCNLIRDSNGNRKEILTANFLPAPVVISTILKSRVLSSFPPLQLFHSFLYSFSDFSLSISVLCQALVVMFGIQQ